MFTCISPRTADEKGELMIEAARPYEGNCNCGRRNSCCYKRNTAWERMVLNKISAVEFWRSSRFVSSTAFARYDLCTGEEHRPVYLTTADSRHQIYPWHQQLTANLIHLVADKALYLNRKMNYLLTH